MARATLVETDGWLETVMPRDGGVELRGWVSTREGGAIDAYRVFAAGRWRELGRVQDALPSPDVKESRPQLAQASACRFALWAALEPGEAAKLRHSAAIVVPTRGGEPGRPLVQLLRQPALPLPPTDEVDLVGGGGLSVALEFFGYALALADLAPSDEVLDVGCGWGRLAYPLAEYLAPTTRYEGFDVVERFVARARTSFAAFGAFRFQTLGVKNTFYEPRAALDAAKLRFPYEDDRFGLALLSSVFTHLRESAVRRYLAELRRTLRPGGACLATFFLLDDEARRAIRAGRSSQPLEHRLDGGATVDPRVPETAIGHPEAGVRRWATEAGLRLVGILPGSWCGRTRFTSYQDLVVLERP